MQNIVTTSELGIGWEKSEFEFCLKTICELFYPCATNVMQLVTMKSNVEFLVWSNLKDTVLKFSEGNRSRSKSFASNFFNYPDIAYIST